MLKIYINTVGKLKTKYLTQGINDYVKRITPYAKVTINEVNDEHIPETASKADLNSAIELEAKRLDKYIPNDAFLIACDLNGVQKSSEQFAEVFAKQALYGKSKFCFLIGGSYGLADRLKKQSNLRLCFGKMTFPHQLMRLFLVEQIYRCMKINSGEPYHK